MGSKAVTDRKDYSDNDELERSVTEDSNGYDRKIPGNDNDDMKQSSTRQSTEEAVKNTAPTPLVGQPATRTWSPRNKSTIQSSANSTAISSAIQRPIRPTRTTAKPISYVETNRVQVALPSIIRRKGRKKTPSAAPITEKTVVSSSNHAPTSGSLMPVNAPNNDTKTTKAIALTSAKSIEVHDKSETKYETPPGNTHGNYKSGNDVVDNQNISEANDDIDGEDEHDDDQDSTGSNTPKTSNKKQEANDDELVDSTVANIVPSSAATVDTATSLPKKSGASGRKRPYRRTKRPAGYIDKSSVTTTSANYTAVPLNIYDAIIQESHDLVAAATEAQQLGRLKMSSAYLLLLHARLVGLGKRFDKNKQQPQQTTSNNNYNGSSSGNSASLKTTRSDHHYERTDPYLNENESKTNDQTTYASHSDKRKFDQIETAEAQENPPARKARLHSFEQAVIEQMNESNKHGDNSGSSKTEIDDILEKSKNGDRGVGSLSSDTVDVKTSATRDADVDGGDPGADHESSTTAVEALAKLLPSNIKFDAAMIEHLAKAAAELHAARTSGVATKSEEPSNSDKDDINSLNSIAWTEMEINTLNDAIASGHDDLHALAELVPGRNEQQVKVYLLHQNQRARVEADLDLPYDASSKISSLPTLKIDDDPTIQPLQKTRSKPQLKSTEEIMMISSIGTEPSITQSRIKESSSFTATANEEYGVSQSYDDTQTTNNEDSCDAEVENHNETPESRVVIFNGGNSNNDDESVYQQQKNDEQPKRKGGRGKKPQTVAVNTVPNAICNARALLQGTLLKPASYTRPAPSTGSTAQLVDTVRNEQPSAVIAHRPQAKSSKKSRKAGKSRHNDKSETGNNQHGQTGEEFKTKIEATDSASDYEVTSIEEI